MHPLRALGWLFILISSAKAFTLLTASAQRVMLPLEKVHQGGKSTPGASALSGSPSAENGPSAPGPKPDSIRRLRFGTLLPSGVSKEEAYECWLRFAWREGGGFGPSPKVIEEGDPKSGTGCMRTIPPIGIREKIVRGHRPDSITYKVDNPGLTTYQVTYHEGVVSFRAQEGSDRVALDWEVAYVPIFGFGLIVKALTQFVISTYVKNIAQKLEEGMSQRSGSTERGNEL